MATPHSDIELQAARRHFFDGVATNCLNNSKSAPLSPSSSPFRTALSSPPIAVYNLAKARDRCCRGVQIRQADFGSHANDLTAHRSHIPLGSLVVARSRSAVRWEVFADSSWWNTSPAPLLRLLHSRLAFSALYKLKTSVITPQN